MTTFSSTLATSRPVASDNRDPTVAVDTRQRNLKVRSKDPGETDHQNPDTKSKNTMATDNKHKKL